MQGLVCIDKNNQPIRNSIISSDSRAIQIGKAAFDSIGHEKCLAHLLNSPANSTAARLAWIKQYEPGVYANIHKILLPGDYIAMKLTGNISTSMAALSEGIFWDFKTNALSPDVLKYFGFSKSIFPAIQPVFGEHGKLLASVAAELSLTAGIPVAYKAGDKPNTAFALNVLEPGEVAVAAGDTGVAYAVSNQLLHEKQSRTNSYAHVNHCAEDSRIGMLLGINGAGVLCKWIKNISSNKHHIHTIHAMAAAIAPGSEGLTILPFGNGPERMLQNKIVHSHLAQVDFAVHTSGHLYRAAQEGIAFAFKYGLDIMKENGIQPKIIKAVCQQLFLSEVFTQTMANTTGVPVELYECSGSAGAAIGAGIGAGIYKNSKEAFGKSIPGKIFKPVENDLYEHLYIQWKKCLEKHLAM